MMQGLNTYLEIDLGNGKLFTLGINGSAFTFDFNDTDLMESVKSAAEKLGIEIDKDIETTIR
jgi:hypothetical protein